MQQPTGSDNPNSGLATHSASHASTDPDLTRFAGLSALIGAVVMFTGAILWQASGTDLDAALAAGDMAGYLADAAGNTLLVLNLTAWTIGVFFLGAGGIGFALDPRNDSRTGHLAWLAFVTAVPLAMAAFMAMFAVIVQLPAEASAAEVAMAELVGWFGSRADWTATVLIVGFGPFLLSRAGRDTWVPGWLVGLGWLAGVTGLLTIVAMFTGALSSYGFLIVPVGLIWMIAAGVVTMRAA